MVHSSVITGIVLLTVAAGLLLVGVFRSPLPALRATFLANAGLLLGAGVFALSSGA